MQARNFGPGFQSVYATDRLTLGINFPIEAYPNTPVPTMRHQIALAQQAEESGFAALWSRDVPLLDPSFGDAGQLYDPWVWLGYIAAHTSNIALCTGSIILPLRRAVDLAKAAASVDQLSEGRLVMGVASGDRPVEYSVYGVDFDSRAEAFREAIQFVRETTHRPSNWSDQRAVQSGQVNLLPKSHRGDIPQLVTGHSRQSLDWIAEHSDGWLTYPRPVEHQQKFVAQWHAALASTGQSWKSFSQSLYIDLLADVDAAPQPIHLGYRLGRNHLIAHLNGLRDAGVNHVTFNVRFSSRPVTEVLSELGEYVVPKFPAVSNA